MVYMAWKTAPINDLDEYDINLRIALVLGYKEWKRKNDGFSIESPTGETLATVYKPEREYEDDAYYFEQTWIESQSRISAWGCVTGIALSLPFAPAVLQITMHPDMVEASIHVEYGGLVLSKRVKIKDSNFIDTYTALAITRAWLAWKEQQ